MIEEVKVGMYVKSQYGRTLRRVSHVVGGMAWLDNANGVTAAVVRVESVRKYWAEVDPESEDFKRLWKPERWEV